MRKPWINIILLTAIATTFLVFTSGCESGRNSSSTAGPHASRAHYAQAVNELYFVIRDEKTREEARQFVTSDELEAPKSIRDWYNKQPGDAPYKKGMIQTALEIYSEKDGL